MHRNTFSEGPPRIAGSCHLSPKFLRKQRIDYRCPVTQSERELNWTFYLMSSLKFPRFVECEISGFETKATGQGVGMIRSTAMVRAFSEAWETLALNRQLVRKVTGYPAANSNGLAAGTSNTDALNRSRGELIERALLLTAWETKAGWRPIRPRTLWGKLFHSMAGNGGWRLNLFRIEDETLGAVLVLLARHPTMGAYCDAKFVYPNLASTERGLYEKVLSYQFLVLNTEDKASRPLPGPCSHQAFYRDPKNLPAFDFLDTPQSVHPIALPDCDKIETTLISPAGRLPAVAFSRHPTWPSPEWDLSPRGGNLWPHPLA